MSKLSKRAIPTLIIAILMISVFAIAIPVSAAVTTTTVYVDITNLEGGDGSQAEPWKTIQEAITHVAGLPDPTEDIIIVATGVYDEDLTIPEKCVGLELRPATGADVTIKGTSVTIRINADEVTVDGFTIITGDTDGIVIQSAVKVIVQNNIFTAPLFKPGIIGRGIGTTEVKILDNTFDHCTIYLDEHVTKFTVSGNKLTAGAKIILIGGNDDTVVIGNEISGNVVADGQGISLCGQSISDGVVIQGNSIHDNDGPGIAIDTLGPNYISAPTDLIIKENDITRNAIGIHVKLWDSTNSIHHNDIYENTLGIDNDADEEVDATLNWWGTNVESQIAGMVEGKVDFDPWINVRVSPGDTITVSGSGVTAGTDVNVYWDYPKAEDLLNTTEAKPDSTWECDVTIPEDVAGYHYIWVEDTGTGDKSISVYVQILPKIKLSPKSGLEEDTITIKGYGFSAEADIVDVTFAGDDLTTLSPITPTTDELGSWTATFDVPTVAIYDDYPVVATDDSGATATEDFTVGAAITLAPDEGPTGTVVKISGRGFAGTDLTSIEIDETDISCTLEDIPVLEGKFEVDVVIPSWDLAKVSEYDITVKDASNTAIASFTLTGLPKITVTPKQGLPGTSITVEGFNFTQIEETEVSFTLGTEDFAVTLETDSNGYFTGTLKTPVTDWDSQILVATDGNVTAETTFLVGMIYATVTPDEGPTGIALSAAGTGFTEESTVNGTIGDILLFEEETDVGGAFSTETTFILPTLPVGDYIVQIMDEEGVTYEATFTVTDTTRVELDPAAAPNLYNVTIEGWNFADVVDAPDFVLYNATDEWILDVKQGKVPDALPAETDVDGNFTAWWEVPADTVLDIGVYTMNITGAEELFAQVSFSVVEVSIDIHTLSEEYDLGDTVSFYVSSTFAFNLDINIEDPTGYPFKTINCPKAKDDEDGVWVEMDGYYVVPYADASFELPSDAVTGLWNWTAIGTDSDEEVANGTFAVGVAVGPQLVITYTPEIVYVNDEVTVTVEAEEAPIAYADVYIVNPAGDTYFVRVTDNLGTCTFTPDEAGYWSIYTTKAGYTDARIALEVLEAVQPELPAETTGEETLDSTGAPKTSFVLGETVLASAEVTNVGIESQPMLIVVQLTDPDYRALAPSYISVTLLPGQSLTPSIGFSLPLTGYTAGTWTAKIMVLDAWPALGGVPIGLPVTITFTVS